MKGITVSLLFGLVLGLLSTVGLADTQDPIQVEYTPYVEEAYPVKARFYQMLEDENLELHKRPIQKIGRLGIRLRAADGFSWKVVEDYYAGICREKGADSLINMQYSHEVNETVQNGDEVWMESDLIVYLDQDQFGHVGFWYHTNRPEIPGVPKRRIKM